MNRASKISIAVGAVALAGLAGVGLYEANAPRHSQTTTQVTRTYQPNSDQPYQNQAFDLQGATPYSRDRNQGLDVNIGGRRGTLVDVHVGGGNQPAQPYGQPIPPAAPLMPGAPLPVVPPSQLSSNPPPATNTRLTREYAAYDSSPGFATMPPQTVQQTRQYESSYNGNPDNRTDSTTYTEKTVKTASIQPQHQVYVHKTVKRHKGGKVHVGRAVKHTVMFAAKLPGRMRL